MKITSNPFKPAAPEAPGSSRAESAGRAGSGAASGRGAVDLSAAARHLATLENTGNDIDMVKIQALRDALASGELKIDASRIADGLLASARDLLK